MSKYTSYDSLPSVWPLRFTDDLHRQPSHHLPDLHPDLDIDLLLHDLSCDVIKCGKFGGTTWRHGWPWKRRETGDVTSGDEERWATRGLTDTGAAMCTLLVVSLTRFVTYSFWNLLVLSWFCHLLVLSLNRFVTYSFCHSLALSPTRFVNYLFCHLPYSFCPLLVLSITRFVTYGTRFVTYGTCFVTNLFSHLVVLSFTCFLTYLFCHLLVLSLSRFVTYFFCQLLGLSLTVLVLSLTRFVNYLFCHLRYSFSH